MAILIRCRKCGQMFDYTGGMTAYCKPCGEGMANEFGNVIEYIKRHPGVTAIEASEATGVDVKKILRFIREGHIEIKHIN